MSKIQLLACVFGCLCACDRGSGDKTSSLTSGGRGRQDASVASLEDALRNVLDRDAPRGASSWVEKSPVDDGLRIAGGHESDAIEATRHLLAARESPSRLRQNAIKLLAQLMFRNQPEPSAEEVYNALNRGEKVDPLRPLKDAMRGYFGDPDVDVAVLAAVEVLKVAKQSEFAGLRLELMHLLPALRERRQEWPDIQAALGQLGGTIDTLTWLREVDASTGSLPPNLFALLGALETELPAEAAPHLRRLFARCNAIVAARDPRAVELAGATRTWDIDTLEAAKILRLVLRAAPDQAASAVDLLHATRSEAMMRLLIDEAGREAEPGARFVAAAVADASLPAPVREHAKGVAKTPARPGPAR